MNNTLRTLAGRVFGSMVLLALLGSCKQAAAKPYVPCKTPNGLDVYYDPSYPIYDTTYISYNPSGINYDSNQNGIALLSWNRVMGATSYTVQWYTANTGWHTISNIANDSFPEVAIFPGFLFPEHNFSFKVRTNCVMGASDYSSEYAFNTNATEPTELQVAKVTETSAALRWKRSMVNPYTILWKAATATTWNTIPNVHDTAYLLTGLTPQTDYLFTVVSWYNFTYTTSYDQAPPVAFQTACRIPSGLNATYITGTNALLSWTGNATPSGHYTLQWKAAAGATWNTVTNVSGTSYPLAGLSPGTDYAFKVLSNCSANPSGYSNEFTFKTGCKLPSGLVVSSITANSAFLQWNNAQTMRSYTLQWKRGNGAWKTETGLIPGTGNTYSYPLYDLSPATGYAFRVQNNCYAFDSVNLSTPSDYSSVVTFSTDSCKAPAGLNATNITTTGTAINWTTVAAATAYKLQWKPAVNTTGWNESPYLSAGNTYSLSGLTPATAYAVRMLSNCNTVASGYGSEFTFTTNSPCTDNFEPNESMAAAKLIPLNIPVSARIGTSGDKDYFKFTIPAAEPFINVSLTNLPGDYDLKVYGSSGYLVGSSTHIGTFSENVVFNTLYAGTYVAYVNGYFGAYNNAQCYTITVKTGAGNYSNKAVHVPVSERSNNFTLYPNPTRGEVNFDYYSSTATTATIRIIDEHGRICKTIELKLEEGQHKPGFNTSGLPAGFYFVQLLTGDELMTTKLFVER